MENEKKAELEKQSNPAISYYKIGEFAKLAHVSISKLRYYDEIGLLKPQIRGKDNSYRIYDSSQLDRIATIKTFQRHGMSLQQMVTILNEKELFFDQMAIFAREKVEALDRQIASLKHIRDEYENIAHNFPVLASELRLGRIIYAPQPSYKLVETDYFQKNFMKDGDSSESFFYMQELFDELNNLPWFISDTGYRVDITEPERICLNGYLVFRLSSLNKTITHMKVQDIPVQDYLRYMAPMRDDEIIDNIRRMMTYCNEIIGRKPVGHCFVWLMVADYKGNDEAPILQLSLPLQPR